MSIANSSLGTFVKSSSTSLHPNSTMSKFSSQPTQLRHLLKYKVTLDYFRSLKVCWVPLMAHISLAYPHHLSEELPEIAKAVSP